MNPYVARWLEDNTRAFNDAYALTELIQWVWRSMVRKGQPVTLYLPNTRMRRLMEERLSDWSQLTASEGCCVYIDPRGGMISYPHLCY